MCKIKSTLIFLFRDSASRVLEDHVDWSNAEFLSNSSGFLKVREKIKRSYSRLGLSKPCLI